uniref:Uncharacterized protein n=1 Tax=Oryza glumipatula TaxID=40148 RepID=A0A0E0A9H5_9ORYZ
MGPTRFFFSPLPTPVPYASHTERRLRFSHTECPRSPSRSSPPPVPSHRRPRPSISVALLLRAFIYGNRICDEKNGLGSYENRSWETRKPSVLKFKHAASYACQQMAVAT